MMFSGIVFACLAFGAIATPEPQAEAAANQPIPATGENGKPSGIFGFDLNPKDMMRGGPKAGKGGTGKGGTGRTYSFSTKYLAVPID
jgi:hypothetical protein